MQITRDKLQNARLSPAEIPGLRRRIKTKQTTVAFEADRYSVGVETIRRAVRGETFRNVREGLEEATQEVVTYGRRATDIVPSDEITRSLNKVIEEQGKPSLEDPVETFLNKRKQNE